MAVPRADSGLVEAARPATDTTAAPPGVSGVDLSMFETDLGLTQTNFADPGGSSVQARFYDYNPDTWNLPVIWQYGGPSFIKADKQFFEGSPGESKKYGEAQEWLYAQSDEMIRDIQAALYNRQMLPSNFSNFGYRFDDQTQAGWRNALQQASNSGKSIWEVLLGPDADPSMLGDGRYYKASLKNIMGSRGPKRAPLRIELSNPEDLKEVARQTALDTIGYVPDDDFLNDFAKLYQGMQSGYQRKAYSAAESGGKVTQPADPKVTARNEIVDEYDTEAQSYSMVKAFDSFLGIIGAKEGIANG